MTSQYAVSHVEVRLHGFIVRDALGIIALHDAVNLIGCHICMEIVAFLYGEQIMLKSAAKIQKCLVSAKYNIPYSADYLFFNVVRQIMNLFLRKNSENTVHIFR